MKESDSVITSIFVDKFIDAVRQDKVQRFEELATACTLIKSSLQNLLASYKQEAAIAMNDNCFDLVAKYNEYCKNIVAMQNSLPEWLIRITIVGENEDQLVLVDEPDYTETIDYSQYQVDRSQPHSMDEDFTNTKICGFDFNGQIYVVDSWQDALVKLDAELFKLDSKKLLSFVNDPKYKGKRVQYFLETPVARKTKPIPGTEIYAWVNLSADQIVHLMKKLLKSYNMEEITIYLRADYSELHK